MSLLRQGSASFLAGPLSEGISGVSRRGMATRLEDVQRLVARPLPSSDPEPSCLGEGLLVGSRHHAADLDALGRLGVTAVLNCAPSGIRGVPCGAYEERGILYRVTNVRRDDATYPLLHGPDGVRTEHLATAKALYDDVRAAGGRVLFFCIAGQNRSAALAVATLMLCGEALDEVLRRCAEVRPFVLANAGFQQQLVDLEGQLRHQRARGSRSRSPRRVVHAGGRGPAIAARLRVPGLQVGADLALPVRASVATVKRLVVDHVNDHLAAECLRVGVAWLVYRGRSACGAASDVALAGEALEASLQLARLQNAFGLDVASDGVVTWEEPCHFELAIFTVERRAPGGEGRAPSQEPFLFRLPAPGGESVDGRLRAWDFASGESFRTTHPAIFSFSKDPRSKRDFREVFTSPLGDTSEATAMDETTILGMGANAVVHRMQLSASTEWDAAVKRNFSIDKMLASMAKKSEAGVAKRIRMAGAMNNRGRLLHFYGLGLCLASNADDRGEYKFEVALLSRYQADFASYTLKKFLDDYVAIDAQGLTVSRSVEIQKLQEEFSLTKVKAFFVQLLNGFRDLTLSGIQAFDFNHLNNVLISRDHLHIRLIDIDGESRGSIQFPSEYIQGTSHELDSVQLHMPALNVDLSLLLPRLMRCLVLGKGRGEPFVNQKVSEICRATSDEKAKGIIQVIVQENFYPHFHSVSKDVNNEMERHLGKVVEWFHAVLLKRSPWTNWTHDLYDAMRCIDHFPIA